MREWAGGGSVAVAVGISHMWHVIEFFFKMKLNIQFVILEVLFCVGIPKKTYRTPFQCPSNCLKIFCLQQFIIIFNWQLLVTWHIIRCACFGHTYFVKFSWCWHKTKVEFNYFVCWSFKKQKTSPRTAHTTTQWFSKLVGYCILSFAIHLMEKFTDVILTGEIPISPMGESSLKLLARVKYYIFFMCFSLIR